MIILGLDISSTTVGFSVLQIENQEIKLIDCGFFKPTKDGNIFERLSKFKMEIQSLLNKYKPDCAAIEEISKFMPGKSSANTIIMLALYNRTAGLTIFEHMNKPPELINVLSIRHGLKLNKILPSKENIPALVEKHLKIKLPVYIDKKGKIKDEYYDQSDGVAVALYYVLKLSGQLYKDKQKKKKKRK